MAQPISSFWDFSLALYAQPQVADTCVLLQDTYGVNVNLLLWCAWLQCQQLTLTPARLQHAHALVDEWERDYVVPLRRLRRKLKQQFGVADASVEALRQTIKQAELLAEKHMQLWLETLAKEWLSSVDNTVPAHANISVYLQSLSVPTLDAERVGSMLCPALG